MFAVRKGPLPPVYGSGALAGRLHSLSSRIRTVPVTIMAPSVNPMITNAAVSTVHL